MRFLTSVFQANDAGSIPAARSSYISRPKQVSMSLFNRRKAAERSVSRDPADDETSCVFVGPKGLMMHCNVHQPLPNEYNERFAPKAIKRHKPGGSIFVHQSAIKHFVRRSLPKIRDPFVLVSGDCDHAVGPERLGEALNTVLNHPLLIAWYSQNLAIDHPKIHPMAIGLDYHTMKYGRVPEWGPTASPRAQEDTLHTTRLFSSPLQDRTPLGYSNWHFKPGNGDRAQVIKRFPKDASYFEPQVTERAESWRRNSKYFFTISPQGVGMDCHRTWEAILLGSTPIIPDLPINRLFETLPVVIIQDWAQITPEFLKAEKQRILSQTFDFAPLLLETWRRKIDQRSDLPELRMRYQDFMALGPSDLRF